MTGEAKSPREVQIDWLQVLGLVAYENGWESQQELPHLISYERDPELVAFDPRRVSNEQGLVLLDMLQRPVVNLLAWHGQPSSQPNEN